MNGTTGGTSTQGLPRARQSPAYAEEIFGLDEKSLLGGAAQRPIVDFAAVIYHGGIGTAALAITAGVPQLIMPMAYDQPDNGDRLVALGVAKSVSPRAFNPPNVAAAMTRLLDDEVKARCRNLAEMARNSRALERCVGLIESVKKCERSRRTSHRVRAQRAWAVSFSGGAG
jgi:hypothetical protein